MEQPERGTAINRFLAYIDIRSKVASVLPFALALSYAAMVYRPSFNLTRTSLFFVAILTFDMATTALNHYMDTRKNDTPLPFSRPVARVLLFALLALAMAAGVALALRTGLIVLVSGALCFLAGIFYAFGPAPISSMPLGETFSGLCMGLGIPFLTILINAPKTALVSYQVQDAGMLALNFNLPSLFRLLLLSLPPVCGIAAIMLTGNICDMEQDQARNVRTLPLVIGKPRALAMLAVLYDLAFVGVAALAIFKILPLYSLIVLIALIPVQINLVHFRKRQDRGVTFHLSIDNFLYMMLPLILAALIGALTGYQGWTGNFS